MPRQSRQVIADQLTRHGFAWRESLAGASVTLRAVSISAISAASAPYGIEVFFMAVFPFRDCLAYPCKAIRVVRQAFCLYRIKISHDSESVTNGYILASRGLTLEKPRSFCRIGLRCPFYDSGKAKTKISTESTQAHPSAILRIPVSNYRCINPCKPLSLSTFW